MHHVHQCIIDDNDEQHDEFLTTDDEFKDEIDKFLAIAAITGKQ